jgi:SET domain-containing protein
MINQIIPENKLYLKYINDIVGWGVFTNINIKKNEIVEICYCLPEKYKESQHKNFAFLFNDHTNDAYLVLGFGMIYNHSDEPNIKWEIIDYNRRIIQFIAIKDILSGEQLCHNYGRKYWESRPKKELTII